MDLKLRTKFFIAFIWGFAEACLFFIVPDVLLTAYSVKSLNTALRSVIWAVLGALFGGTLVYYFSTFYYEQTFSLIETVPAISTKMLEDVLTSLDDPLKAVFMGSVTGVPYKTFALQSPHAAFPLGMFLLVSTPARAVRFIVGSCLCNFIISYFPDSKRIRYGALAAFWLIFYLFYFWLMPW